MRRAAACATTEPRPPWIRCSSAVTMAPVSAPPPPPPSLVQRLDRGHVDDPGLNAFLGQPIVRRDQAGGHHQAVAMIVRSLPSRSRVARRTRSRPASRRTPAAPSAGRTGCRRDRRARTRPSPPPASGAHRSARTPRSWAALHASATSSTDCWLAPSSPTRCRRGCRRPSRSGGYETAMRSWSKPFRITKHAKLEMNGTLPQLARPPAIPTRFASWMPTLKKRSGNSAPNVRSSCSSPGPRPAPRCPRAPAQVPQRLAVRVARRLAQLEARIQILHRPSFARAAASSMDRSAALHAQLAQRARQLLVRGRDAVVRVVSLHEAHALALHRVRDDAGRARLGVGPPQRLHHLLHVVAVDLPRLPSPWPPTSRRTARGR
jgi:hypothetical protein